MEDFEFRNDLERQLYAAQTGDTPSDVFMKQLVDAQIFMPVKDDSPVGGIQRSTKAHPLVVQDTDGLSALVLFTSPERAKPFLEHYPDFRGGLLTDFKWVLEKMDSGFGVVINPGDELGIDLEPELVAQLAESVSRAQ